MRSIIDISKLKRHTKIIVETEETVFEIVVSGPKSRGIFVTGGIAFIRRTKATLDNVIEKRKSMLFLYSDKNGAPMSFNSSKVVSASVFASDGSWYYDAIEKKDK
jgi:hypothetical protein